MVYESDFYTTRRPYRASPSYSTYTLSTAPSRQVRVLPGLGKVHVVHSYDRIVPYIGHKKLTVVTLPPKVYSTRSSVLRREYEWIENKVRPWVAYSPTNRYLNSDSSVRFVYYQNPISGLKYHWEYNPSRYYNFYRIIRSAPSYDDFSWPYYRPLSLYYNYWPLNRSLSYLDDVPSLRSLKLQRKPASLTGLTYTSPSYPKWYHYYLYYRYYWPYSQSYDFDYSWPNYYKYHSYIPKFVSSFYSTNWHYWNHYRSLYYYPKSSYYWSKYLPLAYSLSTHSPNFQRYLSCIFDDETRLIRAQTASLLKQIHIPVPRIRTWPVQALNRYGDFPSLPAKYSNDTYIHRLLTVSPNSKIEYATYYTEPVKKFIGQGHLSCVSYAGDKCYNRRRPLSMYEDAVKNDIQLLSYYINRFREEKAQPKEIQAPLSASRPSRIFNTHKIMQDPIVQEIKDLKDARAARLAKIYDSEDKSSQDLDNSLKAKKKAEEARIAEERAIAEEQARKAAQAKKEEANRRAEQERQEKLAAEAAAERAAEEARQQEIARQAELERERQEEEERKRLEEEERVREEEERRRLEEEEKARQEEELRRLEEEEQALIEEERRLAEEAELKRLEEEQKQLEDEERKRLEEEARIEEERQALVRLEEIARQAEEEREAELARQAEELAELARQEELNRQEQAKEDELAELARQEAELAELERQEAELAELERQAKELDAPVDPEPIVEDNVEEEEDDAAIAADSEQAQDLTDEDVADEEE